jgi:hypothetical protein
MDGQAGTNFDLMINQDIRVKNGLVIMRSRLTGSIISSSHLQQLELERYNNDTSSFHGCIQILLDAGRHA